MDFWSRVELEFLFMFFLTMVALVLSVHIGNKVYAVVCSFLILAEMLLARYFEKLEEEYRGRT